MTVLHVVNSLDSGGMENGVCNIAAGLLPRGVETHVACLERRGTFAERIFCPSHVHVLGKSGGFSVRAAWNLSRLVRRVRPALLHTHNLGPLIYASLATLGGRTCRIVHGEHARLAPWELEHRRICQRHRLYRACRAIHTVSSGQRDELLHQGFAAAKIRAIPNGVDAERFSPGNRSESRKILGIPADAALIGLVGRFGPYKRHDALISALGEISNRIPNAHLIFVGTGGSEESHIRELAANSPRVHFTGFRKDPETCFHAMDLLAVPSSNEGMSNAMLEGMSCGIPALGNVGCGHEEVITNGKDGIVTSLDTPADIAREITSLFSNKQRLVDMGREARITVETRFSMHAMLDAYEQLYRAHAR